MMQKALLEGANPDSGAGGWTPLGKALRRNLPDMAMALIEAGAEVEAIEQNTLLVEIAAIGRGREVVLEAMLDRGVKATSEALCVAARSNCKQSVELLLAHGASPNDPGTQAGYRQIPAICWWLARETPKPAPRALIAATLDASPDLTTSRMIAQHCARARSLDLMEAMARSTIPSLAWQDFLMNAIHAQWQEGVDFCLDRKLVPTGRPAIDQTHILVSLGNSLRNGRTKGPWIALIDRMIDYGFSLDDFGWKVNRGDTWQWVDAPVFLEMVSHSASTGRWKFINHLVNKGAMYHCRYADTGGQEAHCGLAHVLLFKEDWNCLGRLLRQVPVGQWEQGLDPGLVATALKNELNADCLAWIKTMLEQGADPNRPDAQGKRPFEILVDWIDTGLFRTSVPARPAPTQIGEVGALLIKHGADPSHPGTQGYSALQRLDLIGGDFYDDIRSHWNAAELLHRAPRATGRNTRAMRL